MSIDKKRVIAYIDGFNLYFGIRDKYGRKLIWLDVAELSKNLLKPYQSLIQVKYFTSRIIAPAEKVKRQTIFLEAIETLTDIELVFGKYQFEERICRNCGFIDQVPHEKETDVNIAVELISDAFNNEFDEALLISADADLVPVLSKFKLMYPQKKVIIAFPPARFSKEIVSLDFPYFTVGRRKLEISQLPDEIVTMNGFVLNKPEEWKRNRKKNS